MSHMMSHMQHPHVQVHVDIAKSARSIALQCFPFVCVIEQVGRQGPARDLLMSVLADLTYRCGITRQHI